MIPAEFQKYIRSKEFKDLLAKYQQASLNGEDIFFDEDDLLDIAEYYHIKGDADEAEKATDYMLRIFPGNTKALVFKARRAVIMGDVDKAEYYSDLITGDETTDVAYLRAEIMVCREKTRKADRYLKKHYEALPEENYDGETSSLNIYDDDEEDDDVITRSDYALDIALMFCDHGEFDLSQKWLKRVKDPELKDTGDYLEIKAILLTVQEKFKEAEPIWNKYIDLDAYSSRAWLQLAQCQFHTGQSQEAIQSAEYAIAIAQDVPEAYVVKGNALFSLGDYEGALECFKKVLKLSPNDIQGELVISSMLFTMRRYEEGYEHIVNAISLMEDDDFNDIPEIMQNDIYKQAAYLCTAMGKKEEAMQYADKILLNGLDEEKSKLLKAGIYLENRQDTTAFEILSEVLKDSGHDPKMYITVGCLLIDSGLMETGYNMLTQTYNILDKNDIDCNFGYERLAYAALIIGKYDDFLAALEKSIIYNPTETVTIFSSLFPENMPISEYLEYAKTHEIKDNRYTKES